MLYCIHNGRIRSDERTLNMDAIFEKLRDIMVEESDVEEELVTMEANLMNDLGLTSMDVFTVVAELKKLYKIAIPEKELRGFVTVGDIVRYIASR